MKVVYIAGPFRGKSAWAIENNIRRAEALALVVWRLGHAAICPHANTRHFQGAVPDDVWLKGDLEILRRCDAVVLTDYWTESSGAIDEVLEAIERGIPVFEMFVTLRNWLDYGISIEDQASIKTKALQHREARRAQAGAGTQPVGPV